MTIMTALTASAGADTEILAGFCDCARDRDRWLCRSRDDRGPRSCDPGSGLTCALLATITATGRDNWDRVNIKELKTCPCGRPRR